jgi:Ca2+-binding EF-hand superfamily protein
MRKFISNARSLLQNARAVRVQRPASLSSHALNRAQHFRTFSVLTGSACIAGSAFAMLSCGGEGESNGGLDTASMSERIKLNYAARVTTYSSPEKVFLSYASKTRDGEKYMTMNDFIDSLCPFEKKRANKGTPSKLAKRVFSMVDSDGDGLISFQEYIFFNALLQIPRQSIETAFRMFDSDGSGSVDRSEFMHMMNVIESHNPLGGSAQTTAVSTSAAVQRRKDEEKKTPEADTSKFECFFGADGANKLELDAFRAFIVALHEGVLEVEFHRMDSGGKGLLTAEELSLSITSHCNPKAREGFVAKAAVVGLRFPNHLFSIQDFKQVPLFSVPHAASLLFCLGMHIHYVALKSLQVLLKSLQVLLKSLQVLMFCFQLFDVLGQISAINKAVEVTLEATPTIVVLRKRREGENDALSFLTPTLQIYTLDSENGIKRAQFVRAVRAVTGIQVHLPFASANQQLSSLLKFCVVSLTHASPFAAEKRCA